jgi:UTP--glucose-1-phosphate uridylyltransferase
MASMIGTQPFHGVTFDGRRFDCGSKAGYIEANLAIALGLEDLGDHIRQFALEELGIGGIAAAA